MVDAAQIKTWYEAGEAVIVDVREMNEHAVERIPGAKHVPLSAFDPSRIPAPAEGKKLVIHCRSGARCGMAAMRLVASGWDGDIYRMQGGIMGWKSVGGPVRRG
ncbi:MAG: rhodanese-like domain-containing protein [Magnetospirillum sp.]|nr:rhodanese-like domain-containing protein [Magnetospirillum sp.]